MQNSETIKTYEENKTSLGALKKIFLALTDIVREADFIEQSFKFMDRHKDVFEDTEENKVEYY